MNKTDHNHHTKTDGMTLIQILDDKATVKQPDPKTRHANTANKLITLLANVKPVLTVRKLDTSVMSAAPRGQVIKIEQVYAIGSPRRQ